MTWTLHRRNITAAVRALLVSRTDEPIDRPIFRAGRSQQPDFRAPVVGAARGGQHESDTEMAESLRKGMAEKFTRSTAAALDQSDGP
jgi:hypothetical protein